MFLLSHFLFDLANYNCLGNKCKFERLLFLNCYGGIDCDLNMSLLHLQITVLYSVFTHIYTMTQLLHNYG